MKWFGSAVMLISVLLGCGGAESDDKGAGGQAQGGEGGGGADGGAGAEAGGGGQGPADCAAGQVSCDGSCLGVGMSAGGCTVLAHPGDNVYIRFGLALDASHVYWLEHGQTSGPIARVAKAGGAREEFHVPTHITRSLAVDEQNIYWTEGSGESWVRALPKAGGAVIDLVTPSGGSEDFKDVLCDGERVFFSRRLLSSIEIQSIGLDGRDRAMHGTAGDLYSTTMAVDAGSVFWLSSEHFEQDEILRSARTGGEPQAIATAELGTLVGPVVSGGFVYYMSPGAIRRVPASGGEPTEVFTSSDVGGDLLVGHEQSLYWASNGALWRVGMDGKNPTQIVRTGHVISRVAVDASGVYLAINTTGQNAAILDAGFIVKVDH